MHGIRIYHNDICPTENSPLAMADRGSFVGGLLTVIVGVLSIAQHVKGVKLSFDCETLLDDGCNLAWRREFSLKPDTFIDNFAPLFITP